MTIILCDDFDGDVYYWQASLAGSTRGELSIVLRSDKTIVDNANEFYYANKDAVTHEFSSDDFPTENLASYEEYERLKNHCPLSRNITENNPYYNLGIPDSTFKVATNSWRWLAAGPDEFGNNLPIRYYAYSYTQYGNPNIMTHIMIVGYVLQKDTSYTTYVAEDNQSYAKASIMLKVELFRNPDTVVYYTATDNFEPMLGGSELTQIEEPGVQLKKTSSNIPHVVVGRYEFSNAKKKGGFLGLGALVLKEVAVGILDNYTYGFASVLVDIGELIANYSTSVGAADGYVPVETYYSNAQTQLSAYGDIMGSVKSSVKGYLRVQNQFYGTRAWFATPYANRTSVTSLGWVYYVSPSFR